MNFIPKQVVVGVFTPSIMPGTADQPTPERINKAWAELAGRYRYSQLQLSPDGTAGNFLGATADDGITIQPPVIQYRSSVFVSENAGDTARDALSTLARHLGATGFQQLGIKLVYWVALPDNDAPGFVLRKIFGRTEAEFEGLRGGAQTLVAGAKFVLSENTSGYTVLVEPLLRDQKFLFVDVDAQFPGTIELDRIESRCRDVQQFATGTLNTFLEGL